MDLFGALKNVSEAKELLIQLEREEAVLREELDLLLEQQSQMDVKMSSFQKMLPGLRNLDRDTQDMDAVVMKASSLAESVRSKVHVLDLAKSRVYASLKRVDDVIDLKSCVDGVQRAMDAGDYEQAAGHVHRYLALDESVLLDTTTDLTKGSSSSTVSVSFELLREAEARLKDLVRSKFNEASSCSDSSSLERFFKVFPLLNLHEEGLKLLNGHLSKLVRDGAQKNLHVAAEAKGERAGVVYADMLTLLYEGIARLMEAYQPLVETYYGPVWVPELLRHLQLQCDEQVVLIVDQLRDERHLNHKVQTVTIAMNTKSAAGAIRPNILELDTLLTELSLCSARTELYFTFLARKIGGLQTEDRGSGEEILKSCRTKMVIQELIATYIPIEHYFLKESMNKAVSLDVCNADGLTSSMADDAFFVLQKSIRRALSSCSVDGACAMLNHASSLLLTDYKNVLQLKLKIASSSGLDFQSMLQGRLQARSSLGNIDSNKLDSLIALNNIEIVIGNIDTLAKELQAECSKLFSQSGEPRGNKLEPCLADLSSASTTFKQMKKSGMSKLVEICVVPRLKVCTDVIPTVSHVLSEEDLVNFEVNDPFVQQLISCLDGILNELKGSLLVQVFEQVVIDVAGELALLFEAQLFKCTFNQLGGVQLDRELRTLVAYISSLTQWPVRDKFSRLQQVVTILTLETLGEILDYWGSNAGPMIWRLSTSEVRRVLHLRVDFKADDVNKMKL
eukprot:Em0018g767a